ncbi:N-acetylglutamate synthase-like GNAT family acetyltransferase [Pelomonas saccharophila]|uniref:N-acetylglutamate synthase-like GNAT family acetyltransferase n=1 Tax=Roseateles saccharophilus TaxID=304 RepID=A0ABU1YNR7_ROSSA|nr:arsenic resistance N-acetyltransferase ArsN2 [Roseateles saccharophilus]MDR7270512.1 N-acetylglutamate synthase-like GNAT family acetyltransferase [Roseateles saccharophilus]
MLLNPNISLRQAGASDWPAVQALLLANKLPTEGAQAHLSTYLLAVSGGEVVGCAGAEVYGSVALLRSVAIAPGLQKQGIGRLLVERLLQEARLRDISALYLLTVTAPEYFAQYGFKRIKIEDAPQALKASAEFQGACPACAALMTLALRDAPVADAGLPAAVLGAGPVGLAAVAQLVERGLPFVVLEAGEQVGANLRDYGHVQLFSPWQYDIDHAMARLLAPTGWTAPPAAELPRAGEIVERVLQPFATLPEVAPFIKLGARVLAVSREGFDKVKSAGREQAAFLVRYAQDGEVQELRARAVIDATGTWNQPNPIGANGLQAIGEAQARDRIFYGIPDVAGSLRSRYEGRRTLVVGAGHSAANALLALAELARQSPGTQLAWAVRSPALQRVFGGGDADALPARGALGASLRRLRDGGALEFFGGLRVTRIERVGEQLRVHGLDAKQQPVVVDGIDEIICATGQRPDLTITSELRLKLDPWLESTEALGPLIDPNLHSCGTVRPHGHRELAHPEPGFYTVGVKSYGRAPTFLMATGFEQARSVVAAIAGDGVAADRVELELPETGVCSVSLAAEGAAGSCCGPAPEPVAVAAPKRSCGPKPLPETEPRASRCCG